MQPFSSAPSSVVSITGVASFYSCYELYPAVSVPVGSTVKPGDFVTASLLCSASCSPSETQTCHLTISDYTTGAAWTQTLQYQSSMASAEWITEPPYYNGFLPLAYYDHQPTIQSQPTVLTRTSP